MSIATRLPMFPLSTVIFPGAEIPLHVFEPRYQALVNDVLGGDATFGTVLISAGSEVGGGDRRVHLGTRLVVTGSVPFPDGRWILQVRSVERIEVSEWLADAPYPQAMVLPAPTPVTCDLREPLSAAKAVVRRLRMLLAELDDGPGCSIEVELCDDVEEAAWTICALAPLGLSDAQLLLEESDPLRRIHRLNELCTLKIKDLELVLQQR